ncbi:MAG: hypothetical protein WC710_13510 [Gallionella sp.]|jgi:hypothetical protein
MSDETIPGLIHAITRKRATRVDSVDVIFRKVDLKVVGIYTPGTKALSRDDADEASTLEVTGIYAGGDSLISLLDDNVIDEIREAAIEQLEAKE